MEPADSDDTQRLEVITVMSDLFGKHADIDMTKGWTISLTTLAMFQWFNAWNCRSEVKSIFQMNPFSNMFLVGSTVVVILLQLLAVYLPILQRILHTVPLALSDWFMIVPVAFSIVVVEEVRKLYYRHRVGTI